MKTYINFELTAIVTAKKIQTELANESVETQVKASIKAITTYEDSLIQYSMTDVMAIEQMIWSRLTNQYNENGYPKSIDQFIDDVKEQHQHIVI